MSISSARTAARLRTVLHCSAAMASLVIAGAAHAQSASAAEKPTNAFLESQGSGTTVAAPGTGAPTGVYLEPQGSTVALDPTAPEPEIVIANPNTTVTDRDPVNITGIGQMVVDNGGGSVGLCTATLINPRTVLFAAHCVNSRASTAYGANSGGTGIAFGFETNTRANGAGQVDELVAWLFGGGGGPGQYKTNIAQALYNSNYVAYNPLSLEPAAQTFLYGDVAIASLDTPAANIPTWALLFSQLPAQGGGAAGTGYSVNIAGYGGIGTGQTGQTSGSDFRRRGAENLLGALTDLQTFESFLFGGAPNGLTQNLYFIDFDDPRRGLSGASPFDFNAFRDNSVASGKEGITAPGDSGGPLLLNGFSKQFVIGTLSGGYSRFFGGQPAYSYGSVSFYQPLYLYWDWIAANNPYHYVGAVAGNGSWTDPTHWVTTLDPAYNILVGGQPVNGIPTAVGDQKNGTTGDFGQICFQSGGSSDCLDTRTGVETYDPSGHPIGTSDSQPGNADLTNNAGVGALINTLAPQDGSQTTSGVSTLALPTATLANGLPGATNFVPNNVDPVRTAGTAPKYFDVTLAATGTTTLSGANITIDRLTFGTAGAALVIDSGASLTSLINVNHFAGLNTVNGTLTSVGDYSFFGGAILGNGRINAPFLTSVLGQFAPGTQTTIGTLTIGGNLVMSSGTQYFVNLGPNGTSDKIAVVANGGTGGQASIGGAVIFSAATGYTIRSGDTFTILTTENGKSGTFSTSALSAILTPTFLYTTNNVQVQVVAGTYASVVSGASPVQVAFAALLDGDRAGSYSALSDLYGTLDLQNQATIRATLDSWAPRGETLKTALGTVATDNMARFWRDRLGSLGSGQTGGTIAIIGQPLSVLGNVNNVGPVNTMEPGAGAAPQTTTVSTGKVPDDVSVFFAGGYLNGTAAPMPTAIPLGGRSTFDGWYGAAGIEKAVSGVFSVGFGLSYTRINGNTTAGDTGRGELYQGTIYAKAAWPNGFTIDGVASAGLFDMRNVRSATLGATTYTLRSSDQSLALSGELGLGYGWDLGSVKIGPRAAIRYGELGFSRTVETGGPMALMIQRQTYDSLQGRAGLTLGGSDKAKFRPYLTGYYVHDFANTPAAFGANFVGGAGPAATFALAGKDKDWWEVSGGLAIDLKNVELSIGADTTIDRTDTKNQSYRAGIKFRF